MNDDLRALLEELDPLARDALRRVLIRDRADRDAISSQLLRYRDGHGDDWAGIIDFLTLYPEARRRVARTLGELTLRPTPRPSGHRSAAVCLVTLSVATEAQVKGHMCWSSGFDPFEGRG